MALQMSGELAGCGSALMAVGVASAQLLLACVFAAAGATKLRSPAGFIENLGQIEILRKARLDAVLGRALPWTEVLLGVWLLSGFDTANALLVSTAMLMVLTGGLIWLVRAGGGECLCFGSAAKRSINVVFGRNGVLIAVSAAALGVVVSSRCGAEGPWALSAEGLASSAIIAAGAAAGYGLVIELLSALNGGALEISELR